ncbi:MAG: hypothetical protein CSA38_00070 [Flavobacteriales bacterium]|nr:MAG: hypothetical protein CSA38_00070 [Flavobacteriales bacterium]
MRSVNTVKHIFEKNANDLAFVIGNGINRHYKNDNISWSNLLLELWDNHSFITKSSIPSGISFTEFYDALEIQNTQRNNFSSVLQKEVKTKMSNWKPDHSQNIILDKIKEINAPILTTNFDDLIPQSLGLKFRKISTKKFTDFYPWSCYYSDKVLKNPLDGFGVWYPNGMLKYHRSIKLGLSQYMGNVERARRLIHKEPNNIHFEGKNKNHWEGYDTWLHILFNKSLFIFGLGLDQTEVFFRWLLIERAKYFRNFPRRKHKGWFVMKKENRQENEGKRFFLESVGFEIIELESYHEIYEAIWK